MTEKLIASYTAEQTARFMAGGELGSPTIHDPRIADQMERSQRMLLAAFDLSVEAVAKSMERSQGADTARRLRELWMGTKAGDTHARRLFNAMYAQLLTNALTPVERP